MTLTLTASKNLVVKELTQGLLYEGMDRAAAPLGELLAASILESSISLHRAYLAPLPELPRLTQERGYNAHVLLTQYIARDLALPWTQSILPHSTDVAGDIASASLLMLIAAQQPSHAEQERTAALIHEVCPHADLLFLACIA